MFSKKKEQPPPTHPFTSDLALLPSSDGTNFDKIYELSRHPRYIVRRTEILLDPDVTEIATEQTEEDASNPPKKLYQRALEKQQKADAAFHALAEQYGIRMIPYMHLIGEDTVKEGAPALYTVAERVRGASVPELKHDTLLRAAPEIDTAMHGLIDQGLTVLEKGGMTFYDMSLRQFMYGHKEGETEADDHLYLVDTDPYIATLEPEKQSTEEEKESYALHFSAIAHYIFILLREAVETQTNDRTPLPRVHQSFPVFLERFHKACPAAAAAFEGWLQHGEK